MSTFKAELDAYSEGERDSVNGNEYNNGYEGLLHSHYEDGYEGRVFEPQSERV